MGTTKIGRVQATPSAKRMLQRWKRRITQGLTQSRSEIVGELQGLITASHPQRVRSSITSRALRLSVDLAVAALVLSLPLAATAASQATAPLPRPAAVADALMVGAETARVQLPSRGGTIAASRGAVTVQAAGVLPIPEYKLGQSDTLGSIANFYKVSPEAIAFANGITDPQNLEAGRMIRIPPGDGALYTVADGDTVESVAARFKVETAVIMDYNRLYFEPEHFAPGQLIFVRGAELPALVYQSVDPAPQRPTVIARAPTQAPQGGQQPTQSGGGLGMPVNGFITQYFSAFHTGVDVAAPFGTTIGASASGTISATGWVPVGGLRVCVRHEGGLETCYYHTGAVFVSPGQWVERGQGIASIGMTGVTTGPHVHWEAKLNGAFINPLAYR